MAITTYIKTFRESTLAAIEKDVNNYLDETININSNYSLVDAKYLYQRGPNGGDQFCAILTITTTSSTENSQ